jgi:hypothetical protein
MTLRYDEILADNYFGQIIIPVSNPNKILSSSMITHSDIMTDENKPATLTEEFGFRVDDLFNMARHFLKG